MQDREWWLADTVVTLADTLVADFDFIEFLSTLAERIQELIDASEVGLVLTDPQGHLRVMASSTERMRLLELFEVQTSEGPCFDCYRTGEAVINVDLDGALPRWPVFTPMARTAGFRVVHALPLRLRDQTLGAANVFHMTPVTISERDIHLAQALADVATIALLQERAVRSATGLSEQLQRALNSRVTIEQAKGAVAERAAVDMDVAFGWLRGYARSNNLRLTDVAAAVIDRSLTVEELRTTGAAAHARGNGETILVVDDEPAVLELTSRILRKNGYVVLEAATFEDALSLAAVHDFQLLLTDSVLPQMPGPVLAGRVDEVRPGRAVLYMSGQGAGVRSVEHVSPDEVATIPKPFNRHTLLERVQAALTTPPTAPPARRVR